jgi:DNA-directed RNA polymerase subunit beta'
MPVHVPLSAEAQAEAKILMSSRHNLLLPKGRDSGGNTVKDIVLGIYYLTLIAHDDPEEIK